MELPADELQRRRERWQRPPKAVRPGFRVEVHDISYASPKGGRVAAYLVAPPGKGSFAGLIFMHGGDGNRSSLLPGAIMLSRTGAVCLRP